jgi:glucokinase
MTQAIGIDVGGTKIAAGIVEAGGALRGRRIVPTRPERGGRAVLDDALKIARELLAEAAGARIGVAVAELVSPDGRVMSQQTIAWRGLPVLEEFSRLAPSVVEADSRAGALGEGLWGAGRPFRNFYYLCVGTGIGGALVIGGHPFPGARGSAGTVSIPLERIAAGPALVARYVRAGKKAERGEEVTAAAERGEPIAVEIVRSAAEALGAKTGEIVNLLDPEAIIVGGGLGSAGGLYWETFVAATRRNVWFDTNRDLPILRAERGGDATLVGAAAAALGGAAR